MTVSTHGWAGCQCSKIGSKETNRWLLQVRKVTENVGAAQTVMATELQVSIDIDWVEFFSRFPAAAIELDVGSRR